MKHLTIAKWIIFANLRGKENCSWRERKRKRDREVLIRILVSLSAFSVSGNIFSEQSKLAFLLKSSTREKMQSGSLNWVNFQKIITEFRIQKCKRSCEHLEGVPVAYGKMRSTAILKLANSNAIHCIHFWTNILGKIQNSLIPQYHCCSFTRIGWALNNS